MHRLGTLGRRLKARLTAGLEAIEVDIELRIIVAMLSILNCQ
jgi:hypothetical protein